MTNNFCVYILFSLKHKRFYIGQTDNLNQKILQHNSGESKSAAPYRPYKLVCKISKSTRSEVIILERTLKNLNSEDLKKFINKYEDAAK